MSKILFALFLLSASVLRAQFPVGGALVRGEVQAGREWTNRLRVDVYDSSSHLRVGQAMVSPRGTFEVDSVPNGFYEVRLVDQNSDALLTQYVNINQSTPILAFDLIGPTKAEPPSGTVDLSQLGHRLDRHAEQAFQKAAKAIAHDNHEDAIRYLQKAIQADPDYTAAHLELAAQYSATGAADRALEEFRAVTRLEPRNTFGHLNLAILLNRLNQLPEAETEARVASRLDPASAKASFLAGTILLRERKLTPEALAFLKKAYPDYPEARKFGAQLEKILQPH